MYEIIDILIIETGTLGIRVSDMIRFVVPRTEHDIKLILDEKEFIVKYKVSSYKGKNDFKIEFDDYKINCKCIKQINKRNRIID